MHLPQFAAQGDPWCLSPSGLPKLVLRVYSVFRGQLAGRMCSVMVVSYAYCFPEGVVGKAWLGMSGCVKMCTPSQSIRNADTTLEPSPCACSMLKRLDCFLREHGSNIVCAAPTTLPVKLRPPPQSYGACLCCLASFLRLICSHPYR